ncbi:MAG: DUF169 domain-containing protein [Dehalococcoidia bacterium]|jgi:uncharacterized protein (DUF169 family)
MTSLNDFNKYGEELETSVRLRTAPMAVKMLEKESDIPEGAIRPWRDRGQHIAQCQAFALSRRNKETIAMLEEDNWCFAPVIAYGLEDKPEDEDLQLFLQYPRFPRDKYIGIVSAPLKTANFVPDVVIIYSNTTQLRNMLMPLSYRNADEVDCELFPPACAYQVIPVMESGKYVVTLPDPGDYMRALAGEDEIILSVPAAKMEDFMEGIRRMRDMEYSYERTGMYMLHDFPQPPFYQMLFQRWGLSPRDSDQGSKE